MPKLKPTASVGVCSTKYQKPHVLVLFFTLYQIVIQIKIVLFSPQRGTVVVLKISVTSALAMYQTQTHKFCYILIITGNVTLLMKS